MIVFCDLETTGLNPKEDSILEIAIVLTDDDLNELAVFESKVKPLFTRGIEVMDDFVKALHTKSGLLAELYSITEVEPSGKTYVLKPDLPRLGAVEAAVVKWLKQTVENKAPAIVESVEKTLRATPLGGNSVHFDRNFLAEHMSEVEKLFSHRHADCSAVNEFAKRFAPSLHAGRPNAGGEVDHRALADVRASIETAKFYRRLLFAPTQEAYDRFELKKTVVENNVFEGAPSVAIGIKENV